MKVARRERVLVVGGSLNAVQFERRNLVVTENPSEVVWPSTCAVVLVAGDLAAEKERANLARLLRTHAPTAAWHDALCVVACSRKQQAAAHSIVANARWTERNVRLAYKTDLADVAELCARHPAALPARASLSIVDKQGVAVQLHPEIRCLLQRAFSDFERIDVDPLMDGLSDVDGVWRVEASFASTDDRHSPFVVKCGPALDIDMQLNTYRDVVADRVPFRGCAPICIERSVRGAERRLLVSRFVENAERLDKRALTHDITAPVLSIFRDVLHRWRSTAERTRISLLPAFIDPHLQAKYVERTQHSFEAARMHDPETLPPAEIIATLNAISDQETPHCRAHDDLNLRNIFVANHGTEAILIDFTRAIKRPLSKDCARLDVGLAFDKDLQAQQRIPDDVLVDFYSGDLFSISLRHELKGAPAQHRLAAVSALRKNLLDEAQVLGHDIALEYSVAFVAELLYHARSDAPSARVAYQCANAIARRLRT